MNDEIKKALGEIEEQIYKINAINISLHWIGLGKTPTRQEISELNRMLGFIIAEIRALKETGQLDVDKMYEKYYKEERD